MSSASARWIRLGPIGGSDFEAACSGLARSQAADSPPIVLWAEAQSELRLAPDSSQGCPLWIERGEHAFAVIAPRVRAPGRMPRWLGWALAPVVATFRGFGLPAYWDQGGDQAGEQGAEQGRETDARLVWLRGAPIAHGAARVIGECAVVVAGFSLRDLPQLPLRMSTPGALSKGSWRPFRALGARDFEDALRRKLEVQYGWRFEHCWPSAGEKAAIEATRQAVLAA
jgi:hypothetical protein